MCIPSNKLEVIYISILCFPISKSCWTLSSDLHIQLLLIINRNNLNGCVEHEWLKTIPFSFFLKTNRTFPKSYNSFEAILCIYSNKPFIPTRHVASMQFFHFSFTINLCKNPLLLKFCLPYTYCACHSHAILHNSWFQLHLSIVISALNIYYQLEFEI